MQRICVPAAESLESSSQRMRDDPETQLLQVWRSTGGARVHVSSLALDILTLAAPSSVTQDRPTTRRQTMEIKDVKGQYRRQGHTRGLQEPLTFLAINVSQIVRADDKKEPNASRFKNNG